MSITKSTPFTLEVVAAPDFFPAITPATLKVVKGVVAVYNVTCTSVGDAVGPVALSVLGLPPGVTASFSKTSIAFGETSVLSIATTGIALGTFPLSLEGTIA